ncbi:MAG: hypothetical protein ACI4I8_01760 [Oscillospiraceae bacterium]
MIKWPMGCDGHCSYFDCADKGVSNCVKIVFAGQSAGAGADKVIRDEQTAGPIL